MGRSVGNLVFRTATEVFKQHMQGDQCQDGWSEPQKEEREEEEDQEECGRREGPCPWLDPADGGIVATMSSLPSPVANATGVDAAAAGAGGFDGGVAGGGPTTTTAVARSLHLVATLGAAGFISVDSEARLVSG